LDKPINLYAGNYTTISQDTPGGIQQATLWRGERCIVCAPAVSLLSGAEEISFAMSEHVEQKKLTQEKQRLLTMRRKKHQLVSKVKARQGINEYIHKDKRSLIDEIN
jgi:aspartyl-tRNA synthetase